MSPMTDPRLGWALAALALVAGYAGWGWRGLVLAVTVIAFWLLLQFNRALRAMRQAAQAPVGRVASAVMLHARLKPGMPLVDILPIAGSLGQSLPVGPAEAGVERYLWQDAGGRRVVVELRGGRLQSWQIDPTMPGEAPAASAFDAAAD